MGEIPGGVPITDESAIHDDTEAEISVLSAIVLADDDVLIVEDASAGTAYSKLKCLASAVWTYILAKLAANGITLGGTLNMGSNDITNCKTVTFDLVTITTPGAAETIAWGAGIKQHITLDASCTFTFTNPVEAVNLTLIIKQDATGSRLVTWPAAILWTGGAAPTLSTAANSVDIVSFLYDGTLYYGVSSDDFATV